MITVNMWDDGFQIVGHADYDEPGRDIVCASVSTILQLAKMGLNQLSNQYPEYITIKYHYDDFYNYDEFGGMGK